MSDHPSSIYFEILVVLALILLNGFFAMSELAVVSARKSRLKAMAKRGAKGAAAALHLADHPATFLPTVQIGITMVGVLAGAFSGATIAERLADWLEQFAPLRGIADGMALALVVACITYLSLIVGELVPKQIALRNAENIAARVAKSLRLLSRATHPAVWLLRVSSDGLLRLLGVAASKRNVVTEEEIKMMIAEGTEAGVLEKQEKEIIERVLRLDDRSVLTVMTPRADIVWLDAKDSPQAVAAKIQESGHSRYPVARGSTDDIIGIVQARDLLQHNLRGETFDLLGATRQAPVLPEGTTALEALQIIRRSPVHMALVVDEYGDLQGIMTMTDLAKAIIGGIRESETPEPPRAQRRDDGTWLVDGSLSIGEIKDRVGLVDLPEDDRYHTLAGFIMAELGRVPRETDKFVWNGWTMEVIDMDGRRIDKVSITPPA
jgi:putative hemolysin